MAVDVPQQAEPRHRSQGTPRVSRVLYRLLATTDVFITNFPLPVRERLKIAAADLLAINPRLIYGSITAYGEAGEEAARTGFDATAYWARTGLMDMVRATPETEPVRSMPGMGDHPTRDRRCTPPS